MYAIRSYYALRGALRYRVNVDASEGERGKKGTGHSFAVFHAVADDRDDRHALDHRNVVDEVFADLEGEFLLKGLLHGLRLAALHAKTDGVFGTGLGNEQHRNAGPAHRGKDPRGGSLLALEPRARYVDHGRVLEAGYAPDRAGARGDHHRIRGGDAGSPRVAVKAVQAPGFDPPRRDGRNGLGVKDLRAEERKLHRLLVANVVYQNRNNFV